MKLVRKASAIAVAAAFVLTGCGGNGSSSAGGSAAPEDLETKISILAPSYADSSKTDWEKIIAKFNEKYPKVTVDLQIEGWDGFSEKVASRVQSGEYPDILNDNKFASSADEGQRLLYPINELLTKETLESIEPALLANGVGSDGTQWAAPDIASARMLAYNTELFKKAGIAKAPTTWAEMEQASAKLKALGGDVRAYGMPLGREEAQVEASLWLWGAGGTWVDGESLKADTPQAVEAFTQIKKMYSSGYTQAKLEDNRQDVSDVFQAGKLGMLVAHPPIVKDAEAKGVKVALAPVPSKDGTAVATGVTDFIVAFDNKDADRKQATAAFLNLMYSDEMYEGWYKGTDLLPVTKSMIAKAKKEATTDNQKAFLDALSSLDKFQPVGNPQWDALQGALQANAYRVGSDDPAKLLKEIQAQVAAQG